MTELLCFHGSPGLPEDFEFLRSVTPGVKVTGSPRQGYPGSASIAAKGEGLRIVVGYSWGARVALEWALAHGRDTDALVLISPFLNAAKPAGVLKRVLLSLPGLSDGILRKAAPGAITEFIKSSSQPAEAPAFYLAQRDRLSDPRVLRASVLEKTGGALDLAAIERGLGSKPVLMVWGAEDRTGSEAGHVAPLRSVFNSLKEVRIPEAGHALVYTHPKRLADEIQTFLSERKKS